LFIQFQFPSFLVPCTSLPIPSFTQPHQSCSLSQTPSAFCNSNGENIVSQRQSTLFLAARKQTISARVSFSNLESRAIPCLTGQGAIHYTYHVLIKLDLGLHCIRHPCQTGVETSQPSSNTPVEQYIRIFRSQSWPEKDLQGGWTWT
jgi:hypothetical protein